MNNYCVFSNNYKCLKWTDYQVTSYELEEADELCHCNQLELASLQKRVTQTGTITCGARNSHSR